MILINVDSHDIDKHKRDKYGIDAVKELKRTYKFKWDKKITAPRVEIDPPRGSVVVDLKKHRALIPC